MSDSPFLMFVCDFAISGRWLPLVAEMTSESETADLLLFAGRRSDIGVSPEDQAFSEAFAFRNMNFWTALYSSEREWHVERCLLPSAFPARKLRRTASLIPAQQR
jgi:hypothetical protein